MPKLMGERVLDDRLPEPVAKSLQLGGHHSLIGLHQFAGTPLPQQKSRSQRRDR
jgi:hypothetical protein